ncbi:hypothetical protein ABDK56_12795 [Sphingomonas sp. ASV193]|uniref:hypothetical protein n=1 Tax=Sphingomonas sp. ASV193 TaxID=3144405 RepID=UPI0032E8C1CD
MTVPGGAKNFLSRPALPVVGIMLAIALAMRLLWLDRLVGIDGDEAWYGALGQQWMSGHFVYWATPTGNYPGPIHAALVGIEQLVMPREFVALRLPSVVASIGAIALAGLIAWRHAGPAAACWAVVLMAALPGNIIYARYGWDPSYSGLLLLGGVAVALEGWAVATVALFALAVLTHPTNIFGAPLLLLALLAGERRRGRALVSARSGAAGVALLLAGVAVLSTAVQATRAVTLGGALERLASPSQWFAYLFQYVRLLAGDPFFEQFAGKGYGALLSLVDVVGAAAVVGAAVAGVIAVRREGLSPRAAILLGTAAMVAAYGLVAGPAPLTAPTERYGFVLIAPSALALAFAVPRMSRWPEATALGTAGTALLAATALLYLVPLHDGARPMSWFLRTGTSEPHARVADRLLAERAKGPVRVVAEDWFLMWPLRYRLNGIDGVRIDLADASATGANFAFAYADSPLDRALAAQSGGRPPLLTTHDMAGRPISRLWRRP